MREAKYILKKEHDGQTLELDLTTDEIEGIWRYYDDYLLEHSIWEYLISEYEADIDDYAEFKAAIAEIKSVYNRYIDNGSSHEDAWYSAFEDSDETITKILDNLNEKNNSAQN